MAIDRADRHWEDAEKAYRERTGKQNELTEEQQDEIWHYAADHIWLFLKGTTGYVRLSTKRLKILQRKNRRKICHHALAAG